MAKLRKMLGQVDDPQIVTLMGLIEGQSKHTLAAWAADCAERRYVPIYEAHPGDRRLQELVNAVRAHLAGEMKLAVLKEQIKGARGIAQEAEKEPVAQAAARAVSTACAVIQTPTNALGFVFYGGAAIAYDKAGLSAGPAEYDALAAAEFEVLAESLRRVMVPNEPDSAKINWNC